MSTSPSYSIALRLKLANRPGILGRLTTLIGELGGNIDAIDTVDVGHDVITRDITVNASSEQHADDIVRQIQTIEGVRLVNAADQTFMAHLGGKIEVTPRFPLKTRADLSRAYTPGVARVCEAIHQHPEKAFTLTIKRNTVAVVTDGTAVLGLGNVGPLAAMPVMEGKAMLFKEFGGVDAFPICLDTTDPDEIVATVKRIAPAFGGINLEDIASPRCFEIEQRLQEELDIPVFHDDQHGTAVVVLAALQNALKIVGKRIEDIRIVVNGVGAAGTACTNIVLAAGARNLVGCDQFGSLYRGRTLEMDAAKLRYAERTNPDNVKGTLREVLPGADVFLGLSVPNVLDASDIQKMAANAIVFAMANPTPEIMPELAAPYVAVMATGRSDYPNQINNVLCFPGIFRGALACRATRINEAMKLAAARAIASSIPEDELRADYIVPSVFDKRVAKAVGDAVQGAAYATNVTRKQK